jgi:hypothetical protein
MCAAAKLLTVWFSFVSSVPYFLVFLCDNYRIIALIALGCSFAPFLESLFNSHQQLLHNFLLVPLFHISLWLCVMVTNNHCIFYFGSFVPHFFVPLCDEHKQPLNINVILTVNVTQNDIFWCFFVCHNFPCISVWWLPTTIMYFVIGTSVLAFLVPLCDGHQQRLYSC